MSPLLELLFALVLVRFALGQEELYDHSTDGPPFGWIGAIVV